PEKPLQSAASGARKRSGRCATGASPRPARQNEVLFQPSLVSLQVFHYNQRFPRSRFFRQCRRNGAGLTLTPAGPCPPGLGRARNFFSMVNRNLLRQFDLPETELQQELEAAFHRDDTDGDLESWLPPEEQAFETNKIVTGRVINIVGEDVLVDVGYKSEGVIDVKEWYD